MKIHFQRLAALDHVEALDHVKLLGVRRLKAVDGGPRVEPNGVDDQRVAFVMADRLAVPGRLDQMTTSRVLIDPLPIFFVASWSILTTLNRCFLSCEITSSREEASIVAVRRSPLNALAVYVNVAMN